ncbi:hypothetical protein Ancab_002239 [Ancistrocladus abbreviatus]
MASGSPRTRIDEFYASKKKRALSPGTKSGQIENDAKGGKEASPSGKGSLDNYLVTSQNDNLPGKQGPVKRNLTSEIGSLTKCEKKEALLPNEASCRSLGSSGVVSKDSMEISGVGIGIDGKDSSALAPGQQRPEFKQFAAEFLSLYCRELPSSSVLGQKSNEHKRHCSPSVMAVEDKAVKRRHCISDGDQLQIVVERGSCNDKNYDVELFATDQSPGVTPLKEVGVGNIPEPQGSLRKCNQTSNLALTMAECSTPGLLPINSCTRETPKSRGSSMFSPGEAFWSEAIQLADGLLTRNTETLAQAAMDSNIGNTQNEKCFSNFRKGGFNFELEETVGDEEMSARCVVVNDSSVLPETHGEHLDKEASPIPVKHFDFSFEGKNLDENTPSQFYVDNPEGCTRTEGEHLECSSVNHKGLQMRSRVTDGRKAQMQAEKAEVPEMASLSEGDKQVVNAVVLYNDTVSSDSPKRKENFVINGTGSPSSLVSSNDRLDLSNWLPLEICNIYRKRGIARLYLWQVDCLQVDGVLQNKNLVYCASTSAGKSFVAEILMLRRVVTTGKMALLVLPYVSICAEKAEHLEALLEPLGKHVRSYYGNQGGAVLPKDTSVAVCTIEKANSLINRLLEEDRLSEVGIIVIDELHMVADPSRGYLLELMLTKLRYAAGEGNGDSSSGETSGTSSGKGENAHGLQIVGMSATMPNVAAVADWLHAALYQTEFRPVPLEEYIKVGNTIYGKNMEIVRTVPKAADLGGKDPDHVVELCNEVVQEGHSVLVFCSSRKGCESTARHVSRYIKRFSVKMQHDSDFIDIFAAIDALRRCPVGLDPILEETLPSGVAYHHAGLTVEEREIVESCYRKGLIRVLTATSTLAAGVNLPARRVIFRQPRIGRDFIDGTRYRQMAGRAGRTGIDAKGESVLICKAEELKRIKGLLNDSCPPLQSCLSEDKNGMTHAILEVVASGIVQTANDIHRYVRCTLLNSTKPFQDVVKSAQDSLRWLCHRKFLEWNDDTKLYSTTPLGRAAFGSSLSPEESLIVLDDLSRAREGFVLASDLHLVYLVTPTNVEVEPDWELFYERFMELCAIDQSVGNRVGVLEPFLMRMAHGAPVRVANQSRERTKQMRGLIDSRVKDANGKMLSDEQSLRVCKRFYVALMLSRLVQEVPVAEVCEAFKVARGMVQALQENAGRFASMVSLFCERLSWHDLEGLVSKFQNRISFGVRAEIVELTTIPYVKGSRARALYKAGLRTPLAIAEASVNEIAKALFESSSWAAQENSAQRRVQFGVAKKIKNGARKIVIDKAEEARVAAFSAFKSLGLNIPQISRPLLSATAGSLLSAEDLTTSSGDDNASSFVGLENHSKQVSPGTTNDEKREPFALASVIDVGKSGKLGVGSLTAVEKNSENIVQLSFAPENSAALVKASVAQNSAGGYKSDAEPTLHTQKGRDNEQNMMRAGYVNKGRQTLQTQENASNDVKNNSGENGPINVASALGGLDSFLDLWDSVAEFCFDVHFNKLNGVNSQFTYELHGIAICWENSPVYYLSIPKDLLSSKINRNSYQSMDASAQGSSPDLTNLLESANLQWNRIGIIMGKSNIKKFTWNLKVQVHVLKNAVVCIHRFKHPSQVLKNTGLELVDGSYYRLSTICVQDGIDMCVVAWMLWPDEERSSNPNLEKEVKKRLSSDDAAAAHRSGRWKNQMRRAAHNGCCRRVAQTRALSSVLWKLLVSEELVEALMSVEIPLVHVLAEMEFWGIGVNMEGCLQARNLLSKKLKILEEEAYKLAGMKFSLYMPADIANVLYEHLKLRVPEAYNKGIQHTSTDKHCLDFLRDEHPIVPIIKEHRTLAKLLKCTLGSVCSLAKLSMRTQKYTIHGHWLQTSTATGRLSMEEPNLQCVEHMVNFKMCPDNEVRSDSDVGLCVINARDFFVPTEENWLLLMADYSQIELRLMAHFSKDSYLIGLLSKSHGDAFTMIASQWTSKPETDVSTQERDQTKRLVYGILYGMGAKSLSDQLNCSPDEAKEKIRNFKNSFPGVASWLQEAVAFCRQRGYVLTLKGRKRFLSKIKFGNDKEKSKAQRQAVNSICQGSAADIIKIAMVNIYSVIGVETASSSNGFASKFHMLRGRCRILLQVHDELVLEVDPAFKKEAGLLLKVCMETADSLLVPLQVKLKVGKSWGSMEPFEVDEFKGEKEPCSKVSSGSVTVMCDDQETA